MANLTATEPTVPADVQDAPQRAASPLFPPHGSPPRSVAIVPTGRAAPDPPVRWRELFAVLLLVIVCDATIYRGHGFGGYGALFALAPLLLLLGAPRVHWSAALGLIELLTLVLAARLVWLGSPLLLTAGFSLLVLFAMTAAGRNPHILEAAAYACQPVIAGGIGLADYMRSTGRLGAAFPRTGWLKVLMPLAALLGFGTLFILANPDVAHIVAERLEWLLTVLRTQLERFAPQWTEVLFWGAVAWMVVGLLRPFPRRDATADEAAAPVFPIPETRPSPLYGAFRNTLAVLIVLFAAYLIFEFKTLWFRVFPQGFHYSGYAHEGAAWLTVALALATLVLSAIFRGRIMSDPALPRLRRLAWVWSAQNLLLALAVYHRLFIYVGFNGMTRMRTVGLLGISAVIAGFGLVVWKIVRGRNFWWLIQRQLWAVAFAGYLYAVLPVDVLVHSYNVRRILAGDPAPSVQISVHPIDSAGVLALRPLVHADDPVIREGIRALLAERAERAAAAAEQWERQGWTSFQIADRALLQELVAIRPEWDAYSDPGKRAAALAGFHEYAYQWY